ncbi:MAG: hypothetical protein WDM87_08945 [Terracidiphilus sp.]
MPCKRLDTASGSGNDDQRAGNFVTHSSEGCGTAVNDIAGGQYIYDDSTINGVVPGTLSELYFNFGALESLVASSSSAELRDSAFQ